jgi:hypothetical protein
MASSHAPAGSSSGVVSIHWTSSAMALAFRACSSGVMGRTRPLASLQGTIRGAAWHSGSCGIASPAVLRSRSSPCKPMVWPSLIIRDASHPLIVCRPARHVIPARAGGCTRVPAVGPSGRDPGTNDPHTRRAPHPDLRTLAGIRRLTAPHRQFSRGPRRLGAADPAGPLQVAPRDRRPRAGPMGGSFPRRAPARTRRARDRPASGPLDRSPPAGARTGGESSHPQIETGHDPLPPREGVAGRAAAAGPRTRAMAREYPGDRMATGERGQVDGNLGLQTPISSVPRPLSRDPPPVVGGKDTIRLVLQL